MNVNTNSKIDPTQLLFGIPRHVSLLLLLVAFTMVAALLHIGVGAVKLSIRDIVLALWGTDNNDHRAIIMDYRMPRMAIGLLVGAGLAVAGVIAQSIMRNPLASPSTLGITAGAGLGAVIVALLFPAAAAGMISTAAFAGGALAAAAIYLISYKDGVDPLRLILVGLAMGALCAAGIDLIITKSGANVSTALIWLTGSLWGRGWKQFWELLPWIAILLPLVWRLALHLDVINLGDSVAGGLGVRVQVLRLLLFTSIVGMAGAAVAAAGSIGFIGLICPHMARGLVGSRHKLLIPVAAVLGALLVIAADTLGRIIKPPVEIPAGLIITVIGAPYFIYLMWRQSKKSGPPL